jgi:hypothetical protein
MEHRVFREHQRKSKIPAGGQADVTKMQIQDYKSNETQPTELMELDHERHI